ncbi:hypothetical protein HYS94_03705 [Candidatus Daviesbacteria bacterium]|nr:hypothetical protein [Candidatus Daviesbacteria bacterium]
MDSKQVLLAIADALRSRYANNNFEITSTDEEVLIKGVSEEMKANFTTEVTGLISEMANSYSFDAASFAVTQLGTDISIKSTNS